MDFLEQFRLARLAGAPLLVIRTPDPAATISTLAKLPVNEKSPVLQWDRIAGLRAFGGPPSAHVSIVTQLTKGAESIGLRNSEEMLVKAQDLPKQTVLFMLNLHHDMRDPAVIQALWNVRDTFKTNNRMLVILCPDAELPPELLQDVLLLDEPLPDSAKLEEIINETYSAADVPAPKKDVVEKAKAALAGLSAFPAEQQCAMSIRKEGLDLEQLYERKRKTIEQTPGLSVWRGREKFDDIGGCDNIKTFIRQLRAGNNPPNAIVFQDEIEKEYAGAMGDLSGVTQELLKQQLTFMQDRESTGLLFLGHPGTAKSAMAKAIGNELQIPTIQFDIGAMKGSLIGESNANMRLALKVVEAVSQGRALFVASCNSIEALTSELRRRFEFGLFFFDLPSVKDRESIWKIYFKKFGLKQQHTPADTGWTGAEIRNCCDIAWRLGISVVDAANYIVPIAVSAKERIERLRNEANGRYTSANYRGAYQAPPGLEDSEPPTVIALAVVPGGKRKINVNDKAN